MPEEIDEFFKTPAEVTTELPVAVGDMGNLMQQAQFFASSNIIPATYQNKPANCFIALDLAQRIGCNFMTVVQNMYIIQSRPSWSSQFLISTWNTCGKYTSVKYKMFGTEADGMEFGCIAYATELETHEVLEGPKITMQMAKDEGWLTKNGSKWRTMSSLMIKYRAAAFLIRLYAPELTFGLHTREEVEDITNVTPQRESLAEKKWREQHETENTIIAE